jgi:hypothetical protein
MDRIDIMRVRLMKREGSPVLLQIEWVAKKNEIFNAENFGFVGDA